jgi:hypothetical protein
MNAIKKDVLDIVSEYAVGNFDLHSNCFNISNDPNFEIYKKIHCLSMRDRCVESIK